jgi:hypothetical protein
VCADRFHHRRRPKHHVSPLLGHAKRSILENRSLWRSYGSCWHACYWARRRRRATLALVAFTSFAEHDIDTNGERALVALWSRTARQ